MPRRRPGVAALPTRANARPRESTSYVNASASSGLDPSAAESEASSPNAV